MFCFLDLLKEMMGEGLPPLLFNCPGLEDLRDITCSRRVKLQNFVDFSIFFFLSLGKNISFQNLDISNLMTSSNFSGNQSKRGGIKK